MVHLGKELTGEGAGGSLGKPRHLVTKEKGMSWQRRPGPERTEWQEEHQERVGASISKYLLSRLQALVGKQNRCSPCSGTFLFWWKLDINSQQSYRFIRTGC